MVGFGAQYAAALLVNKNAWNKLPTELQKILRETATEWGAKADAMMQERGNDGMEAAKGFRTRMSLCCARGAGEMGECDAHIAKEWAERLDKQGLPAPRPWLCTWQKSARAAPSRCVTGTSSRLRWSASGGPLHEFGCAGATATI